MSECDTIFGCLIILGGGGMNITYSGLIKEASERYFGGTNKFNAPTRYGVVLTCLEQPPSPFRQWIVHGIERHAYSIPAEFDARSPGETT